MPLGKSAASIKNPETPRAQGYRFLQKASQTRHSELLWVASTTFCKGKQLRRPRGWVNHFFEENDLQKFLK